MNSAGADSALTSEMVDDPDNLFGGPGSVAWRVLSAPATALMIAQITNLLEVPHRDFQAVLIGHDPLFQTNSKRQRGAGSGKMGRFHDRLRRTVTVPLPILFGDRSTAVATARRLFDFHRPMTGVLPDDHGTYTATSPQSMLFASVTIAHAGLVAYERYSFDGRILPRRLPPHERNQYFREMAQLAVLMGVPREDVPASSSQIAQYYRSIADKMTTLPNWRAAQRDTALALMRTEDLGDLKGTLVDVLLVLSNILGYAVLPSGSRRLHQISPVAGALLAIVYVSALPFFALLQVDHVRRMIVSRYLGPEYAAVLDNAAQACRLQGSADPRRDGRRQ